MLVTKFLVATQRIDNLKKMTLQTVAKVIKIQLQGKRIFCMNRIRLCVLRQMWNNQKRQMIENLKVNKAGSKKKHENQLRKKRLVALMALDDKVREVALKSYFHMCKEK